MPVFGANPLVSGSHQAILTINEAAFRGACRRQSSMDTTDLQDNSARASSLMRILSNEKRLMILCNLVEKELSVQELQEATGFGQSTVSQQLALLRAENLVTHRREAQSVYYRLDSEEARTILETLHAVFCANNG